MNCKQVRRLLRTRSLKMDQALEVELQDHLHQCPSCQQAFAARIKLNRQIRENQPLIVPPLDREHYWLDLRQRLKPYETLTHRHFFSFMPDPALVTAAGLLILIIMVTTLPFHLAPEVRVQSSAHHEERAIRVLSVQSPDVDLTVTRYELQDSPTVVLYIRQVPLNLQEVRNQHE